MGPKAQNQDLALDTPGLQSWLCPGNNQVCKGPPNCWSCTERGCMAPPPHGCPTWLLRWDSCACWGDEGGGSFHQDLSPGSSPGVPSPSGLQDPGPNARALCVGWGFTSQLTREAIRLYQSVALTPAWIWFPVRGAAGTTWHQCVWVKPRHLRAESWGGGPQASQPVTNQCPLVPPRSIPFMLLWGLDVQVRVSPHGGSLETPLPRARVDICGPCSCGR